MYVFFKKEVNGDIDYEGRLKVTTDLIAAFWMTQDWLDDSCLLKDMMKIETFFNILTSSFQWFEMDEFPFKRDSIQY